MIQFKNYTKREFPFSERIVGISGKNGVGKTNLLDAIHYLCFTRSYFSRGDAQCAQEGMSGFRLEGQFDLNDKSEKAVCVLRESGKKEFTINDQAYEKFSHHIGRYPCVVIAPDDASLITGGSEERRKFLDYMLSQVDAEYLRHLITYTQVLNQRNSLLKSFAETGNKDTGLLDVLDGQLTTPGEILFNKRKEFLISFLPAVRHIYLDLAQVQEEINLYYESELNQAPFSELLAASRQRDFLAMRTTTGVHRDNIEINLHNQPFRNRASQGQRKSLLFALKLAELDVLKQEKGFPPLLLLDDVFEKLDEDRITNLFFKVCLENNGQVFITDTNKDRLTKHFKALHAGYEVMEL